MNGVLLAGKDGPAVVPLAINEQVTRTRDGDRFWFENGQFSSDELERIRSSTLSAIIMRNTSITGLPANVFTQGTVVAPPAPAGTTGTGAELRTLNGSGNNLGNPSLGQTGSHLLRNFTSAYAD